MKVGFSLSKKCNFLEEDIAIAEKRAFPAMAMNLFSVAATNFEGGQQLCCRETLALWLGAESSG